MTLEEMKEIGRAASVSIAAGHDSTWTGNFLEPELWEALRIEMQRRFRRSTGETQAVLMLVINPTTPPIRNEALEAAAKVAESGYWYGQFQTAGDERRARDNAARIRSLKEGGGE